MKNFKYYGSVQGVRVYITGRKLTHVLPSKDKVYSIFKGLNNFELAGWVENTPN